MEELNLSHKKNGETLDCSEWNKLVSVINYIIDFYNEYPTKLSEFENDSNFISENNIVQIILELIDNGTLPSTLGIDGKSAYEIAVERGYIGTELLWLNSLKGAVGESAYQIAVNNGFIGTQQLWINSLKGNSGQDGAPGKSAYQSYVETTNDSPIKTEALWIASLKGVDGINGTNGIDGQDGSNGLDGVTPHIDPTTKHWMIGETDTGVLAEGVNGQDGTNGVNGQDGVTPHIDSTTGNWFIGNIDTGVKAHGFSGDYNDLSNKPTIPAAQIQADWNQSDSTALDYIKNKPTIPSGSGTGTQVLADWNESDSTAVSYIQNKPTLFSGSYADLSNKPTIPDAQIQSDWSQSDNTAKDYIKNKPSLFSGSYNDLTNKPALFSGSYTDLTDKPSIPAAQIQANWNQTNNNAVDYIKNKPSIPAAQVLSDWNATTGLGVILNKPTIPTVPGNESASSGGNTLSVVTTGDKYNWNNKASIWSGTLAQYDALSPNYNSNTIYIITASS